MYYYECQQCGARYVSAGSPGTCGGCGGAVQNLSVRRE
ncbi:MAG: rubrerythrin-like domain-containing protein [Haloarculaceae archaeon]